MVDIPTPLRAPGDTTPAGRPGTRVVAYVLYVVAPVSALGMAYADGWWPFVLPLIAVAAAITARRLQLLAKRQRS